MLDAPTVTIAAITPPQAAAAGVEPTERAAHMVSPVPVSAHATPGRSADAARATADRAGSAADRIARRWAKPADAQRWSDLAGPTRAALAVGGLLAVLAAAAAPGHSAISSSTSSSASTSTSDPTVAGAYLGQTPLGCAVHRLETGTQLSSTDLLCTQGVLAERLCGLEIDTSNPDSVDQYDVRWRQADGFAQSYFPPGDTNLFECQRVTYDSNGMAHARTGVVNFTDVEWQQLIGTGTPSAALMAKLEQSHAVS